MSLEDKIHKQMCKFWKEHEVVYSKLFGI